MKRLLLITLAFAPMVAHADLPFLPPYTPNPDESDTLVHVKAGVYTLVSNSGGCPQTLHLSVPAGGYPQESEDYGLDEFNIGTAEGSYDQTYADLPGTADGYAPRVSSEFQRDCVPQRDHCPAENGIITRHEAYVVLTHGIRNVKVIYTEKVEEVAQDNSYLIHDSGHRDYENDNPLTTRTVKHMTCAYALKKIIPRTCQDVHNSFNLPCF